MQDYYNERINTRENNINDLTKELAEFKQQTLNLNSLIMQQSPIAN